MTRIIAIYGLISGLVVIFAILGSIFLSGGAPHSNVYVGYLIMLVALSSILIAVKQHRDQNLGGVIRFWPALGMGVAIAVVAGIAYVAVWEVYLATTDYAFMDEYAAAMLEARRAAGASAAELAKAAAEAEKMKAAYANPLMRLPITFSEIFPVGLLVAIVSAALVRNPKFLPARSRPT